MIVNRNWVEGKISIHAPRAGSDNRELDCCCRVWISIHAPRAGSDYIENMKEDWKCYFNPRSPCGERLH